MPERPERRQVARLLVPRHLSGVGLEVRETVLLDLSSVGARIEHREPLHTGFGCYLDLPRAFGRLRLPGRVVWTRRHRIEQTPEGEQVHYHQSGLTFTNLTPAQQSALAAALETFQAAKRGFAQDAIT